MHARREDPSIPAWSGDRLDSPSPPEIEAPYFDTDLGAWVLSRYADVLAALRASNLAPVGPRSKNNWEPPDETCSLKMRSEAIDALSPAQLRTWRGQIDSEAQSLAACLPVREPVELMNEYARPLCLSLAAMVTGVSRCAAESFCEHARKVSAAAAEPYDLDLRDPAKLAGTCLRSHFHSGPEVLRDSGFVAISQTMPCILGNAWFALMHHPQQWTLLHRQPGLVEQAIEELLRRAGLVRILARKAMEDIDLGGVFIRRGERIILRIVAADRDPDRFPCPDEVDLARREVGHLALGAGRHACVGASLIRMAAAAITHPLVQRYASMTLVGSVEWQGGSVFRFPKSLRVSLKAAEAAS